MTEKVISDEKISKNKISNSQEHDYHLNEKLLFEFVEKIGSEYEFKLFKDLYTNVPKLKFAVIKISGESLEKHEDEIAQSLAFMQMAGIIPVVVHGAGSVLDKKLKRSMRIDGVRFTRKSDLPIIQKIMHKLGKSLEQKINKHNGKALLLQSGIFFCTRNKKYGYVGEVKYVSIGRLASAVEKGFIPIITPLGVDLSSAKKSRTVLNDNETNQHSRLLNINADTAAKEIVKAINPKKLIFVTETGGVLDQNNKVIPFLNLHSRAVLKNISGGMLHKVREIKDFLMSNEDCAVTITSPNNLLKEIFTIKGSGTYIKYHSIKSYKSYKSLDIKRLKALIENAFCGRSLVSHYFHSKPFDVILEKDYEGVAIIKKVKGVPYLDKFAVAKVQQGTGLGQSIWNIVIRKYPKLIWRAKKDNPINNFYIKNCDGLVKRQRWNIYWRGLDDNEMLPLVKLVVKKPRTLI